MENTKKENIFNEDLHIPETTLKKCMRSSTSFLKSIQENQMFSD